MPYALVELGRVTWIADTKFEAPIGSTWADVASAAPQVGWVARLTDGQWVFAQPIPESVTNFQARAVLLNMPSAAGTAGRSLFQDVDDALHAQGGVALQAWEYANDITRDGELVGALGVKMGLTSSQLDALFIAAAGVSA